MNKERKEYRGQSTEYRIRNYELITKAPFDSAQDRRKDEDTKEERGVFLP